MKIPSHVVAIAALSLDEHSQSKHPPYRAMVAAAAVVSRYVDGQLDFSFHQIARAPGVLLQRWTDRLVADDPLLVGYRLHRTSRLLCRGGFDRNLARSFTCDGRVELADWPNAGRTPLSVSAVLNGAMAVDQEALEFAGAPIGSETAATLALINAAASWLVWFRRATGNTDARGSRNEGLIQLRAQIRDGGVDALTSAIDPVIH